MLAALRRVKGSDFAGNIVDLGLVSEIFIKDDHPYFSITIPANRAEELEQLRLAAEKVVADISGVSGVTAVLTAEASGAPTRTASGPVKAVSRPRPEHPRVEAARAKGATEFPASSTSSPLRPARAASANRLSPSIWRWACRRSE